MADLKLGNTRKGILSYFFLLHVNGDREKFELWGPPENLSETYSVNWSPQQILNRQSPLVTFTGTAMRMIQFDLKFHIEGIGKTYAGNTSMNQTGGALAKSEKIIRALRAACYAEYSLSGLKPPTALFVFGENKLRGYIDGVTISYEGPMLRGRYSIIKAGVRMGTPIQETRSVKASSVLNGNNTYDPFKF